MNNLSFHVHNDLELLTEYPIAFSVGEECYIMQENRVVFIGKCKEARIFIEMNNNEYKKDVWK